MNGRVCKQLRKAIYGADGAIRERVYTEINKKGYFLEIKPEDEQKTRDEKKPIIQYMKDGVKKFMTQIMMTQTFADEKRRAYQNLKRMWLTRPR